MSGLRNSRIWPSDQRVFHVPVRGLRFLLVLALVAVHAQPASSQGIPADTVWSVGVYTGPAEQEFGEVIGGSFDAEHRAYLLDAGTRTLRIFDQDGAFLLSLGRTGRGPGDFSNPQSIRYGGDGVLYVLDTDNGLLRYRTDREIAFDGTTRLPVRSTDFCFMGDRIFVFGERDGHTIHEVSENGELLSSFGDLYGPATNSVQGVLSRRGKLACIPEAGIITAMSGLLPVVRAYNADDGRLIWSDSLPSFRPIDIQLDPPGVPAGGYAMLEPTEGFDRVRALHPLGDRSVLIQTRRAPSARRLAESDQEPFEDITSCVVQFLAEPTINCVTSVPLLLTFDDSYALSVENVLFSRVKRLRLTDGPIGETIRTSPGGARSRAPAARWWAATAHKRSGG